MLYTCRDFSGNQQFPQAPPSPLSPKINKKHVYFVDNNQDSEALNVINEYLSD